MKNKNMHKIFIGIIALELLLLMVLYLFFQNPCGSACNTQSFLNPFEFNEPELCMTLCSETQHFLFYPLVNLTILTTLIYIFFIIKKMKGGN